jgi:hypothetical protein
MTSEAWLRRHRRRLRAEDQARRVLCSECGATVGWPCYRAGRRGWLDARRMWAHAERRPRLRLVGGAD